MPPRLLLDTHVILRWLGDIQRLSRAQSRALEVSIRQQQLLAISAISLLEIAILVNDRRLTLPSGLEEFFSSLQGNPVFRLVPLSYEIAIEAGALHILRDPADRTIVATARIHRLQLVTSDQRIIESNLVPVVD